MATKDSASEKAAAARKAATALRAQQRAAARRNTILAAVGALALVAIFVVIVAFIVKGGGESGPYAVYDNGVLKAPSMEDQSGGIYVSAEGVASGTPPDGAVRVDLWTDPLCPVCKDFDSQTAEELGALRNSGLVALYHHPIAILDYLSKGTSYSTRAVSALGTVAEQAPDRYWAVVEALYANQPGEQVPGLTNEEIAQVLQGAGVPVEVTDGLATGEFTQWVLTTTSQASVDGVSGTPTIRIAGVEQPSSYYLYVPGLLTYDVLVAQQGGTEALTAVAAERDRVYSSAATQEEADAALGALLQQQVAELQASLTPQPSPSASA